MILIVMITILISGRFSRMVIVAVLTAVNLAACGPSTDTGSEKIRVVATTSIWGDVVSEIVGDDGSVEVLIPRGSDAHDYVPSSGQVAALAGADLVVANGLDLEEGLQDVLDAARSDGVLVLEVASELDPLPFPEHEEEGEHDEEGEHHHGDLDPHVWFDADRVALAAEAISESLAEIEPSVDWEARADSYGAELETLSRDIEQLVATIPTEDRKLVTNHEALGYFAARYGMEVVGVVIPGGSTLGEPSSAELAALVRAIEEQGVKAIFAETTNPSAVAEAVAGESAVEIAVVELYTGSLGEPGSGAETLIDMLRTDATLIADALN